MGKKKQQQPSKPQEFHSTPFSSLKGVVLPAAVAAEQKTAVKASKPVTVEDDGSNLFLLAMHGVRTLNEPPGKKHAKELKTASSSRSASKSSRTSLPVPVDSAASEIFLQEIGRLKLEKKFFVQLPDEDELKPLSGNRVKQLKRGIITVDHQLDLHGLTRDEALAELPRFLRSARLRGQAAALVITGKGLNSPGEPVLQQAVAGWLRDAGREQVVEFAPAPREMGGSGAFVVFLRPIVKQPEA
jgi:DNA-nicking Smr family endonuclease